MIETVAAAMRDLQAAVVTRQLYPIDHPRVVDLVVRVTRRLSEALVGRHDVAVFLLDAWLVCDGQRLQNVDGVVRGVFATLAGRGIHRVTFHDGLSSEDVRTLVDAIAGAASFPASLARISFSAMDDGADPERPASMLDSEQRDMLLGVWREVVSERRLPVDALDVIVVALLHRMEARDGKVPLSAVDAPHDYDVTHIANVSALAMAFAEDLGMSSQVVRDVGLAALLHDVGKLRVPREVLEAQGHLTEHQRALIRRHPEDGARILMGTPGVPGLAVAVAFEHHLQFDGGGYPAVPRGWRVNLASAITHVCDVYDALRCDRPYRPALPPERILQIIRRDAGTVFDPGLLDVFFEAVVPRVEASAAAAH